MRKLLFTMCLLVAAFAGRAQVEIFHGSLKEGLVQANRDGKKVIAMVSTTWCGPCKMVMNKVLPTKEAGDYVNPRYVFLKYVIDVADPDKIADTYKVSAFPTFLFLDGEGKEIVRHIGGVRDAEELKSMIENIMNDPVIGLKRDYEADPLKHGVSYAECLFKRYDFGTLENVINHLFGIMEREAFYDAFGNYLKSGMLRFSDELAEGFLDDSVAFCGKLGVDAYEKIMKRWIVSKNWAMVLDGMQPEEVRHIEKLLDSHPLINTAHTRFIFSRIDLFREKKTETLLEEVVAAVGKLDDSDISDLYCLVVYQCGKAGLLAFEERFRSVATRLDELMKASKHSNMVEMFEMIKMKM